jgi:aspartate aminotransferase
MAKWIFKTRFIHFSDLILVSPGWTTYAPQAKLAGYSPHIVKTSFDTEWKVTPTMLEDLAANNELKENKLMILNNPGNPCIFFCFLI